MQIKGYYDPDTGTWSYLVWDESSGDGVVIDPLLDYDQVACRAWSASAMRIIDDLVQSNIRLHYVIETHAHADHLSAAQIFKRHYPDVAIVIGSGIKVVQSTFKSLLSLDRGFPVDGRQFDLLVEDGQTLEVGSLAIQAISTPGHTPSCMSFRVGNAAFVGDTMFMPDCGTGRCDFPNGSAQDLFESIQKIYALDDDTRIYTCHDYPPQGRKPRMYATVAEQKRTNVHLPADRAKADFVEFRTQRDGQLQNPRLLFQSIQVNIAAGKLPDPDASGHSFLKIPVHLNWQGD